MDISRLTKYCTEHGCKFECNQALAPHTTMRIGGECDIIVSAHSDRVLQGILQICREDSIPMFVLGKGSNVLVSDRGWHGCVIMLTDALAQIIIEGCTVTAYAGASLAGVCRAALHSSLTGLEFAYGIPGTAGGALYMNAGAYGGEMSDVVVSARYIDESGQIREITRDEMELSYRHSFFSNKNCVILSVTMQLAQGEPTAIKSRMEELMQKRRDKQPLEFPSCGSTFKRPAGYFAAALIEECGLKGFRVGGAMVSEKHSGFVINYQNASFDDVIKVVNEVKRVVKEKKGVELECEMLILE